MLRMLPYINGFHNIVLLIKVEDDVIKDVKVETFGCVAAIATSSMTTQMAKGMTIEEAKELTRKQVADALDGLPPRRCTALILLQMHFIGQ